MMALGAHIARFIQEGALFWRPQEAAKRLAVPTGPVRTRGAQDCHQDPPAGMRRRGAQSDCWGEDQGGTGLPPGSTWDERIIRVGDE